MLQAANNDWNSTRSKMKELVKLRAPHFRPPIRDIQLQFKYTTKYRTQLQSDFTRLTLNCSSIQKLWQELGCEYLDTLRANFKVGDRAGLIVFKFDHIWVWMGKDSARFVFHQDEANDNKFYLLRCFSGPEEKQQYNDLLNEIEGKWALKNYNM